MSQGTQDGPEEDGLAAVEDMMKAAWSSFQVALEGWISQVGLTTVAEDEPEHRASLLSECGTAVFVKLHGNRLSAN